MSKEKVYTANEEGVNLSKSLCLELVLIVKDICDKNNLDYWLDGGTLLGSQRHKGFIPWDDDIDICFPKSDFDKLMIELKIFCQNSPNYLLFHNDTDISLVFDYFGNSNYLIDGVFPIRIDLIPIKIIPNTIESIKIDKSLTNIFSIYYKGKVKKVEDILEIHKKHLPIDGNYLEQSNRFSAFYSRYLDECDTENRTQLTNKLLINYCFNDMSVSKERPYYDFNTIFPLGKVEFEGYEFKAPNNIKNYLTILYGENYMVPPPKAMQNAHFTRLYSSDIENFKIKMFLNLFYSKGADNIAYKRAILSKVLYILKGFTSISVKLLVKSEFRLLIGFYRYTFIKLFIRK